VGLLLAADPLGSAAGAWLFGRWRSPMARTRAMVPLAVASGLALVPCALRPGLLLSMILWAGCGACSSTFLIQAQALLTRSVPNNRRAAVIGLASGSLQASQGLAVLAAGLLAQHADVYRSIGVVGAVTAVIAALLGLMWRRTSPRAGRAAEDEPKVTDPDCSPAHLPPQNNPSRPR
jgi:MFS family permease